MEDGAVDGVKQSDGDALGVAGDTSLAIGLGDATGVGLPLTTWFKVNPPCSRGGDVLLRLPDTTMAVRELLAGSGRLLPGSALSSMECFISSLFIS